MLNPLNPQTASKRKPVIRKGQFVPYRKGTHRQIDERIGCVTRLLRAGKTKSQIHHAVREKFSVEWRQCDRYIAWLTKADGPDI
jgi:hypothetical protein